MFSRRLDSPTGSPDASCAGGHNCPAVLELETGDFAVIGTDITEKSVGNLPPGCGCGAEERVVRVPRRTLVRARSGIPVEA
jgi:hypothetical protein